MTNPISFSLPVSFSPLYWYFDHTPTASEVPADGAIGYWDIGLEVIDGGSSGRLWLCTNATVGEQTWLPLFNSQ